MRARVVALASLVVSCGGASQAPPPAPQREGPAESILRIGRVWQAREDETGFRTAPSPIAAFRSQIVSRLTLGSRDEPARESVRYDERLTLRDGRAASCSATIEHAAPVVYGLKAGVPAIELEWPASTVPRTCDLAGFSAPLLERAAGRARFILRDDQLVGVEPPAEKRAFIPVD
jgi:hypothetical protein